MEDFFRLSRSIVKSPSFNPRNVVPGKFISKNRVEEINQDEEIEKRLKKLLTHAFRRPVNEKVHTKYTAYAKQVLAQGESFQQAVKEVLSAVLASPRFLYLYDGGIRMTLPNKQRV